jgi:flagellar motor component MotA
MSLRKDLQEVVERMSKCAIASTERHIEEAGNDPIFAGRLLESALVNQEWADQLQEILDKDAESCENCDNSHITYWAKSGELKTSGCAYWGRNTRPDGYCHNHKPKEVKP